MSSWPGLGKYSELFQFDNWTLLFTSNEGLTQNFFLSKWAIKFPRHDQVQCKIFPKLFFFNWCLRMNTYTIFFFIRNPFIRQNTLKIKSLKTTHPQNLWCPRNSGYMYLCTNVLYHYVNKIKMYSSVLFYRYTIDTAIFITGR